MNSSLLAKRLVGSNSYLSLIVLATAALIVTGCNFLKKSSGTDDNSSSSSSWTVTASGDGHETYSPATAQTVTSGASLSFTVTASSGYTLSTTPTGTCPAGSWSGSAYTTGAITANCTVDFSATASVSTLLYVPESDTGHIDVYSISSSGTTHQLVRTISDATNLSEPMALAVDSSGNIFVSDYTNSAVYKYGPNDTTAASSFTVQTNPYSMTMDGSDNVYVAGDNQINIYSSAGTNLLASKSWAAPAGGSGPLGLPTNDSGPWSLAVDSSGSIYAAMNRGASSGNQIWEYPSLATIESASSLPTPSAYLSNAALDNPFFVWVDSSDNIYSAIIGSNIVAKFSQGQLVGNGQDSGSPQWTISPQAGAVWVCGVMMDSQGHYYVADQGSGTGQGKVIIYASDHTTVLDTITGLSFYNSAACGIFVK